MTLREWYDNLSENGQKVFRGMTRLWFDENEPDGYRKLNPDFSEELSKLSYHSSSDGKDFFAIQYLALYKQTHTVDEFNKVLLDTINKFFRRENGYLDKNITPDIILLCDDIELRRDFVKLIYTDRYEQLPLGKALYLVNDFSNVPRELSKYKIQEVDCIEDGLQEIVGTETVKQLAVESPNLVCVKNNEDNDLFDDVFFCENGWNDDQRRRFIRQYYCNTYSHKIVQDRYQDGFRDFIKRIVAVDQKYLRYMYDIIAECPALGNKIYDEKKPDDELTGNETPEMTFRYSKLIRKLARIANICARKSLSGVNGKALKELSPLIKLYGYNFNDIYDCIMDIEENA